MYMVVFGPEDAGGGGGGGGAPENNAIGTVIRDKLNCGTRSLP